MSVPPLKSIFINSASHLCFLKALSPLMTWIIRLCCTEVSQVTVQGIQHQENRGNVRHGPHHCNKENCHQANEEPDWFSADHFIGCYWGLMQKPRTFFTLCSPIQAIGHYSQRWAQIYPKGIEKSHPDWPWFLELELDRQGRCKTVQDTTLVLLALVVVFCSVLDPWGLSSLLYSHEWFPNLIIIRV